MKGLTMKIQWLFFGYLLLKVGNALECQNEDDSEYCVSKGYIRDKMPPSPPLNITMSFSISVRKTFLLAALCFSEKFQSVVKHNLKVLLWGFS